MLQDVNINRGVVRVDVMSCHRISIFWRAISFYFHPFSCNSKYHLVSLFAIAVSPTADRSIHLKRTKNIWRNIMKMSEFECEYQICVSSRSAIDLACFTLSLVWISLEKIHSVLAPYKRQHCQVNGGKIENDSILLTFTWQCCLSSLSFGVKTDIFFMKCNPRLTVISALSNSLPIFIIHWSRLIIVLASFINSLRSEVIKHYLIILRCIGQLSHGTGSE